MTLNVDLEPIKKCIEIYGEDLETMIVMEELSELSIECNKLSQSMSKSRRAGLEGKEIDIKNILEESSDVLISINTIMQLLNIGEVEIQEQINKKQQRTIRRIKKLPFFKR